MTSADLLLDLARVADGSPSPEAALEGWGAEVPGAAGALLAAARRRLALGMSVHDALEPTRALFGADTDRLAASARLAREVGCRFAPLVRGLAQAIEQRTARRAAGAAAAGAARASARIMAGLPAFLFPLGLLSGAPVLDAIGMSTLLVAFAVGLAGWRWVERLVPAPPTDDAAITFGVLAAAALDSGVGLGQACDASAGDPSFERARRRTWLGMSWPAALALDDNPAIARLGRVLERCERWGSPAARDLMSFVHARRAEMDRSFELSLRRAPVRMVAPLVSCALPAFCLVTVVPLLREVGAS